MLMIMDLQGWGRIRNRSPPGSTASLQTSTFTGKVWNGEVGKKKNNLIRCFKVFFRDTGPLNIIRRVESLGFFSHGELHSVLCCAISKMFQTNLKTFITLYLVIFFFFLFFFFSPISVPAHYRILSVPLPCLILIFPLVGFISFLSPLTLNSPTLRLHTNHSGFNTPLRLAGTILWKTSTAL